MQRRSLPVAYIVAAGNQAQTGMSVIASALIEDTRVTAVGIHIEAVDDVALFERLAFRAAELRKPIVATTVGRSEAARAAAISHTASIAGSEAAGEAFFKRVGVPRVRSVPEFLETLKLLHVHGALPGRALCSMSCSGGEAALVADAVNGRRVHFRALTDDDRIRVRATLNDFVAITNPLDYHTFVWGNAKAMAATFSAMMQSRFDLSLLILDFPRMDRCNEDADWDAASAGLSEAVRQTGGRAAVVASLPENMPENRAAALMASGIAPLAGIDEALTAAEAAAFIGEAWSAPASEPILAAARVSNVCPRTLAEAETKQMLSAFGLSVPKFAATHSPVDAVAAADAIGYPVAVKALGIAHKSEAGAVRLNLASAAEVEAAAKALAGRGQGILVETMVTDGVAELLIGVSRDKRFGLLMTIAAGGVLVELLGDCMSLLLPATEQEIRAAMLSLKTAPLLKGYRGRPVADLGAAVAAAVAIARFAEAHADTLDELEVNPLIVRPAGRGAVAVDALARMRVA
jgi:acyl-CoA synthetase (NDP forming)